MGRIINAKSNMPLWIEVEAEIKVPINELAKIVKCNCSICKRKNATMGMVKNEDFKII